MRTSKDWDIDKIQESARKIREIREPIERMMKELEKEGFEKPPIPNSALLYNTRMYEAVKLKLLEAKELGRVQGQQEIIDLKIKQDKEERNMEKPRYGEGRKTSSKALTWDKKKYIHTCCGSKAPFRHKIKCSSLTKLLTEKPIIDIQSKIWDYKESREQNLKNLI